MENAINSSPLENASQSSEQLLLRPKIIGKLKQIITERPRPIRKQPIPIRSE